MLRKIWWCSFVSKACEKIQYILDDGRVKCPGCGDALSEVEEIDDDIEATGYIEVIE